MLKSRSMSQKRILLVEDHKDSSRVLRAGLENLSPSIQVTEAGSGETALDEIKSGRFDLLVADVLLPGMTGLELMAHFWEHNPESKVILISGVSEPAIRTQVARAGADAFFFKPIDLGDFLDAVERILSSRSMGALAKVNLAGTQAKDSPISNHIADLRERLGALSVALINERGQILARAGSLPDAEIETTLMPDLMVAFFASLRVAAFTDAKKPDDLLCYRGERYHLYLTNVGPSYALLIATKPSTGKQLANLAEACQVAVAKMGPLLDQFELRHDPAQAQAIATKGQRPLQEDTDPQLEGLLHKAETKPLERRTADKFWKSVGEEILVQPARRGALTYEQARRLGLTPPDN